MIFKYGATRVVFIFEKFAMKIARIRPIMATTWLYKYLRGEIEKNEKQKQKSTLRTFVGLLIIGIPANIVEYKYSIKNPDDDRVFKTLFCFLGLINFQMKASNIKDQSDWKKYCKSIGDNLCKYDLKDPEQFGVDEFGKIRIVDYGHNTTVSMLSAKES